MSRYDLPERGSTAVWERNEGFKVIKAYQRGELKSRDEMNEEAMWDVYKDGADISEALDAAWEVADE